MSNQVPIIPVSNTPIATWSNRVSNAIPANRVLGSHEIGVKSSAHGTRLFLKDGFAEKEGLLRYRGEFDPNAAYDKYDVIRVMGSKTYVDYQNNPIAATVGTWVCVQPMADLEISDKLRAIGHPYTNELRTIGGNYAPTYPEPTTTDSLFWESLMPFMEVNVCVDGAEKTYVLCGFEKPV